jgi:PTS system N-acetylglucosamine-specific IIC component
MMFGLPGACLAMYHTAIPERRRAVGGLLGSIALTSILTGVTEPIEFTFMFLAPALYAVHALLTGLAFIVMHALNVRLGFGFSAGLFDFVLNFNRAARPLWLLPVGAVYFALYYVLFRWVIVRFDLKTPGREPQAPVLAPTQLTATERTQAWIAALGGARNLRSVDACTTRLRIALEDQDAVDEARLRQLGARGVVRPGAHALQVVVGTGADQLAGELRSGLAVRTEAPTAAAKVLAALGGAENVRQLEVAAGRIRIEVKDPARIDRRALGGAGLRGYAFPSPGCVHVLAGPAVSDLMAGLSAAVGGSS